MSLRVLHVLDHSIPLHSGYTFRTLSILREQRRRGWTTFQMTSPKQGATASTLEEVDGWSFFRTAGAPPRLPLPGFGELALMKAVERRLFEVAHSVQPHLLHVHSPVLNALPALRVARRLGLPAVYEVRAFWEDAAVDHGTSREGDWRYRTTRRLETNALRRARHVFTICEGLRGDIVGRGLSPDKVTVIPNAVDAEAFDASSARPDEALRLRLGLQGAPVVGFIGSFYAYEGLDLLIDALPALLARVPDARVLLVGGGPEEAALKQRAAARGVAERVVFAGRVPHATVQRYYELIDVLAYPRHSMRLTELVTPLKPLEAMAQGRLVVASNVGGHRELIRDGVTGTLFEAGSADALAGALVAVLGQPARWPELRAAGRRYVETERTWARSVERYAGAYQRLVPSLAL